MENVKHGLIRVALSIKAFYKHILSLALIVVLILIVYGSDLEILLNEALQNEALSHVLLVPFFVGFLFYVKRDAVRASVALERYRKTAKTRYLDEAVGVALCLIAFLLYWYGSYTFYPLEYHFFSLPIFLMGVIVILFSLKTLFVLAFPTLFLLFLVPLPSQATYVVGGALANFNTQAAYGLLKTLGLPVTLSSVYGPPTIAFTTSAGSTASFTVDLPCSGIYSLIAFTMFATFLAYVAFAPVLRKASLFLLGFVVFAVLNIVRIALIVSVGYWFGEETAMFVFHNLTGLLFIFAGILFILFVADRFLKMEILPRQQKLPDCTRCRTSEAGLEAFCSSCGKFLGLFRAKFSQRFWAKLFLLLLGCSIVTLSIHAPTFTIAQGPIGVASGVNWENAASIFPQIPEYQLTFLYRDVDFEKVSGQDASLFYAYFPENQSKAIMYIAVGVSSSISNLHSWEVCLITWQTAQGRYPLVNVLDSRDTQLLQDIPIIARYLVFESPFNYTQVTLYWYEKATFNMGVTVEQKYVRISLIILTQGSAGYEHFEDEMLFFGQKIAEHWQPLKTQSLISLGVSAQQLLLALTIGFVVFMKTAQRSSEWRKRTNNMKVFDKFASSTEKLILQTVLDLSKEKKAMGILDISDALESRTGKKMRLENLLSVLNRLEEYGFIGRDVAIFRNQPRLVWRAKY